MEKAAAAASEEKQIFKLLIYAVDSAEHGALGPLGAQLYYMCDYTFMECIHSTRDAR
jgi:hypothetical protein